MSDSQKPANGSAEQDLHDLTNGIAKQRNAFSGDEFGNGTSSNVEDADQSLSSIHTGDRKNYEDAQFETRQEDFASGGDNSSSQQEQGSEITNDAFQRTEQDRDTTVTTFENSDLRPEASDAGEAAGGRQNLTGLDRSEILDESDLTFNGNAQPDSEEQEVVEQPLEELAVNVAPEEVLLNESTIAEDAEVGDVVGTVSAIDVEGENLTYAFADDAGGMFTIDEETGEITVAGALDYETTDSYVVTVNVSDGQNVTQQSFTIHVSDVNEAPEAGNVDLGVTLEDTAVQFTAADLLANSSDVDGDSLLVTNVAVDPAYGTVTEVSPGQFEFTPTDHYSGDDIPFTFTISDGEFTETAVANLDITAVSDAPDLSVSLGSVTRSAISGGETESVVIDASNVLNTDSGFTVQGRIINDDGSLSDPSAQYVSDDSGRIGITGYNDAIVEQIGSRDIAGGVSEELIVQIEGSATSATVGFSRLFSNEGGDGHDEQGFYTLYMNGEEVGSGSFTAEDGKHVGSAQISAEDGSAFDQIVFSSNNNWTGHEDGTGDSDYFINSISIEQEIEDIPVNVYELNVTADLVDTDGSETLSAVTFSNIPEDATLSAGTRNDDGSWTVDAGDLDGLVLTVPADMDGDFDLSVSVSAADGTADPAFSGATLTIPKIEYAPEQVAIEGDSIAEDASVGDIVGTVSAVDINGDGLTYRLSDDADGLFSIDPNTGEITLAGALDYETADSHSVTVDVFDGELTTQKTFTINVGDINEAVHSVALDNASIGEDAALGDVVGTVSAVDPDGDTLTYTLTDDADGMFTIDPDTGEIKVAGELDYETTDSYTVTVDVSDGTYVAEETFTINIGDAEAPDLAGSGNEIEIMQVGDAVDLSNMDVFPELTTQGDVEQRVGTEVFEDMVSDSENLTINYQSDVTVTFEGEIAGYRNSIGAYQINTDGTITGAELLWGDASSDKLEAGVSQATYEGIESGATLGFFVISNGFGKLPDEAISGDGNSYPENGNWMFVSPDFDAATQDPADHLYNINTDSGAPKLIYVENDGTIHTQRGDIFHSTNQEEFNPDSNEAVREHFIAGVDQENGILNFGFEDTKGGGDHDFNDGMFSAEIDVRDLMEAPNPLFTRDGDGQSSFQINDVDSTDLQEVVVTVQDMQAGDSLTLSGPYKIVDGQVLTFDGKETGISVEIVEDGTTTSLTFSGNGDLDHYEAIVQNINFSNTSGSHDIAGVRPITVVATDSSGEVSDPLNSAFTIAVDEAVHSVELDNNNVAEDADIGDLVGFVSAIDPEGRDLTFALTDNADGRFAIDAATGEITLAKALDYESDDSHSISVSVSDGVNVTYQTFEVAVGDVDENNNGSSIEGTNKADNLVGDGDGNFIMGYNGDDTIYGNDGNDTIEGDNHEDLIYGGAGDDSIAGGNHDDTLYGGTGDDAMSGGHQDDQMYGGSGSDTLSGGFHDDTIFGGSGDDYLSGDQGNDVVYGESGSDTYEFSVQDGFDTFIGGDAGGWSDTILLSDGMPSGDVEDWLNLTSGSVEQTADGEIFLSEDAAGTITLDSNAVLTFEGVEKIEG